MNFSENGASTNDENVLIVRSPGVAEKFSGEFDRMWKVYTGDTGDAGPAEEGDDN